MEKNKLSDFVKLAEAIYSENLTGREACIGVNIWQEEYLPEVNDAIHFLYHFIADADVREKDAEYGLLQREKLRQVICNLKTLQENI